MKKTDAKDKTFINPDTGKISITDVFGGNLSVMLADKILIVDDIFSKDDFCRKIHHQIIDKTYTQRVEIFAANLQQYLPDDYNKAIDILMQILGPENKQQTGMFSNFYWLMPVAKFIEKYGLNNFEISIKAIQEVTKRNTGEYAIRPFARKYPGQTLAVCRCWAQSDNFHLRRLASEGLRPKLPWAHKLDTWIDNPQPVFAILESLKEDEIRFVKKSVANHIRDWIKVNPEAIKPLLQQWSKSHNEHTQWMVRYAQR